MGIGHRDHRSGGVARDDLPGDVRAGQHSGGVPGQHLVDDLGHPLATALLEALDQTDHRSPRPEERGQLGSGHARKPCEGTAMIRMSAGSTACCRSVVAVNEEVSSNPGRYVSLVWRVLISSATAAARPQVTAGE